MKSSSIITRDSSLDLVCGFLITYMILYHAYLWCPTTKDFLSDTLDRLLFFFMPWFYFKSGMFHVRKGTKEVALSNVKKLLYPFFVYTIIGEIIYWVGIYTKMERDFNLTEQLVASTKCMIVQGSTIGNQPLWFLISLYLTKVVVTFLENQKIPLIAIIIISGFIAWISSNVGAYINGVFYIPYLIMSTSIGMFFYGIGTLMQVIQYKKNVYILALLTYSCVVILFPSQVDVRLGMLKYGSWIAFMLSSLAGIIVINNLTKLKILQFPFLIDIGENSLSYYCSHWILFSIITTTWGHVITNDYHLFAVLCIGSTFCLPIYAYWINYIKNKHSNYKNYL